MKYKEGTFVVHVGHTMFGFGFDCGKWTPGRLYVVDAHGHVEDDCGMPFSGPGSPFPFNHFKTLEELDVDARNKFWEDRAHYESCSPSISGASSVHGAVYDNHKH